MPSGSPIDTPPALRNNNRSPTDDLQHYDQRINHGFSPLDIEDATMTETVLGMTETTATRLITKALCDHCQPFLLEALWHCLKTKRYRQEYQRDYTNMTYRQCAFCNLILRYCRNIAAVRRVSNPPSPIKVIVNCDIEVLCYARGDAFFRISSNLSEAREFQSASLEATGTFATLCSTQPATYDSCSLAVPPILAMDTLQSWFKEARRSSVKLRSITVAGKPTAIILIDCHNSCLVDGQTSYEYLALSYVWGKKKPTWLFTSKTNVAALFRPSSLASDAPYGRYLPRVIREAVQLTQRLGVRYLWIDAVCIIQDCDVSQTHMIGAMCEIYRNAFVTIMLPCCLGADDTIPGLNFAREIHDQRRLHINLAGSTFHVGSTFAPGDFIVHGRHSTRAWTLQEHAVSTRILMLTPGEAFLCEPGRLWREASTDGIQIPAASLKEVYSIFDLHYNLMSELWPLRAVDIQPDQATSSVDWSQRCNSYATLLDRFTLRKLTYPNDIIRAFTGIYNTLHQLDDQASSIAVVGEGREILLASPSDAQDTSISVMQGINLHLRPFSLCWRREGTPKRETPKMMLSSWTWATQPGAVTYVEAYKLSSSVATVESISFGPRQLSPGDRCPSARHMAFATELQSRFFSAGGWVMDPVEVPHTLNRFELGFWAICLRRDSWCFGGPQMWSSAHSSAITFAPDTDVIGEAVFDREQQPQQPVELVCLYLAPRWLSSRLEARGLVVKTTGNVTKRIGVFELNFRWEKWSPSYGMEVDYKFVVLQ